MVQYPNTEKARKINMRMCEELGLDPHQITNLQADWNGATPEVAVTYTGVITLSHVEFRKIIDAANASVL